MMSSDSKITDVVQWTDQAVQLKDFVGKFPVPNVVKVTKGQYRNIGFAKSVHNHLYLFSVSTGKKILAESVKLKEGKRAVLSEQKYAIPLSYQGWFEVLSEDGKAVKAIENIKELGTTYHFSKNNKYLVRENIKALLQGENGELATDKHRVIYLGEVISITGDLWMTQTTPKGMMKRKLLSCTDSNGDTFYFDYEQKGLFSPIAGQQNISGVHNVQAMLQKFRLPITVRLVYGIIPTKLEKHCTGVFRLLHIYSDETAFLCPLKKDSKMVPVSTREPLKLVPAGNFEEVKALEEFEQVHERCANMYNSFMNSIHVLFSLPEPEAIADVKHSSGKGSDTNAEVDPEEENILFEEVEDIYQYVRDGGPVPPAPRPRPIKTRQPPPLPDKKSNTKTKLALLGKSIVNKFSQKDRETAGEPAGNGMKSEANTSEAQTSTSKDTALFNAQEKVLKNVETTTPPQDVIDGKAENKSRKKTNGEWDWEEPIYEPLDKIRSQKKKTKKVEEIQLDKSPALLSDPIENTVQASSPTVVKLFEESGSDEKPSDVQNLRQIYKQHSVHESVVVSSGSQNSLEKSKDNTSKPAAEEILDQGMRIPEPDYEDNPYTAPPIPPKHFDMNDIPQSDPSRHSQSSGSGNEFEKPPVKFHRSKSHTSGISAADAAIPRRNSPNATITVSANNSPNAPGQYMRRHSQKHLPRGVPTTVHIEAPNPSMATQHGGVMPRVSIVAQTQVNSHPPYVAVARVGDVYEDRYSNGRPLHRGNSEHARRKLQSMYL